MNVLGVKGETLGTHGGRGFHRQPSRWLRKRSARISASASRASQARAAARFRKDKPTGLVYISVWYKGENFTRKNQLPRSAATA